MGNRVLSFADLEEDEREEQEVLNDLGINEDEIGNMGKLVPEEEERGETFVSMQDLENEFSGRELRKPIGLPNQNAVESLDSVLDGEAEEDSVDLSGVINVFSSLSLPDEPEEEQEEGDLDGIISLDGEIEPTRDYTNHMIMESINSGAFMDGLEENGIDITGENYYTPDESKVISGASLKVMEPTNDESTFNFGYVHITKLKILERIRKSWAVGSLVQSIKSTGLLSPLVVTRSEDTEGEYIVVDGYRRLLACAEAGIEYIPCIINEKVDVENIRLIESLYNLQKSYSIEEMIEYIKYLNEEKGIFSASVIEYLLQMEMGDYNKLKELLEDNDEEILTKMFEGTLSISQAFKKLEARRKKETNGEKEQKQAEKAFADGVGGNAELSEKGELSNLSDEEKQALKERLPDIQGLKDKASDTELDELLDEGEAVKGYEPHKQNSKNRERIDEQIRKAVFARDNNTCFCCKAGGESYVDVLDCHHIKPVSLGGVDHEDNSVTLCLTCHRMVHNYAQGSLHIAKSKSDEEIEAMSLEDRVVYQKERERLKNIVILGMEIRKEVEKRKMTREEYRKENPIENIGRNKPGKIQEKM